MRMHVSQIGVAGTTALRAAMRAHASIVRKVIAMTASRFDHALELISGSHFQWQLMQSVEFFDEASED